MFETRLDFVKTSGGKSILKNRLNVDLLLLFIKGCRFFSLYVQTHVDDRLRVKYGSLFVRLPISSFNVCKRLRVIIAKNEFAEQSSISKRGCRGSFYCNIERKGCNYLSSMQLYVLVNLLL